MSLPTRKLLYGAAAAAVGGTMLFACQSGGVKSGDAVIALNGSTIDGSDSLVARIRAIHPGTQITLTVVRDGKQMNLQVTLGTRPASNNG